MKTSKRGLEFLCHEEGCVLTVYHGKLDAPDVYTVGVGHVVLPADRLSPGDTITRERCLELLSADVAKVEAQIAKSVKANLSQNEYDALVSLGFNIGCFGLSQSSVVAKMNAGDRAGAADAFLLWKKTPASPDGLLPRRQRERALFLEPSIDPPIQVTPFDLQAILDFTPHREIDI